ncbi:hypothetical protein ACFY00_24435 [Kitasatospora sp. NPDC001540]|uniref:hypothetical protein n=1 Tax=Kitasatospora sp. NPDC001540 TaxID=3364014 RepID=UPI0036D075F0
MPLPPPIEPAAGVGTPGTVEAESAGSADAVRPGGGAIGLDPVARIEPNEPVRRTGSGGI